MTSKENFFISSNTFPEGEKPDYKDVDHLIDTVSTLSQITYQTLYVIDYYQQDFLYVSENPLFLCGYTAEEVKRMGYHFYLKHVPEKDLVMLTEINKAGFSFFSQLPPEERKLYTISYDFHLTREKRTLLVNHKLTPLALAEDGKMWLAVCAVSLSAHTTPGHVEIRKLGETNYWGYAFGSHRWKMEKGIVLNERENDILLLSARGYTMNDIGDRLFLSVDTIKFYRKKLFEKLEVKNITEALSVASNYKLI